MVLVRSSQEPLKTKDAQISSFQPTFLEELLSVIANPNIALLLVSIGSMAIVYEIINPGGYVSGIIGVILLLIGLYAIGQLPVNYAGLALIVLAVGLFVAELFTPTFGALTAMGVVAFIFGGIILFNTSEFTYELPLPSIIGIPLAMAAFFVFVLRFAVKAMKAQPTTGREGLIGATGTVKAMLEPQGSVFVWGERWNATSEDGQTIEVGEEVEVTEIDGFRLRVKKATK